MANERLRAAILSVGMTADDLAERLGVDRKTVDRWVDGHVPYRRNQHQVAKLFGLDPSYLWPPSADQARQLAEAELIGIWPIRSLAPTATWIELFRSARQQIDVLVYAGFWLSEDPSLRRVLLDKANSGVSIRFLIGNPSSQAVLQRGTEEGIGDAICAKIRNTIHNYRDLIRTPASTFRTHGTTLYSSIYRADDEMLVSTHLYGLPGHMAPLLHLKRLPGAQLFGCYQESFERVWAVSEDFNVADLVA